MARQLHRQRPLPTAEHRQPTGRQPAELDLVVRLHAQFSETGHLLSDFRQQNLDLDADRAPAPVSATGPEQRPLTCSVLAEQGEAYFDDGRLDGGAQSRIAGIEFLSRGDAEGFRVGDVSFVEEEGAAAQPSDLQGSRATTDGEHTQHVRYGVLDLARGHRVASAVRRTAGSRSGSDDAAPEQDSP